MDNKILQMLKNIIWWSVSVVSVVFLVYVIMNFPAVSKRLLVSRSDSVLNQVEAKAKISLDNALVWDAKNFDQIFLSDEARLWYRDYFGKYNDEMLVIPSLRIEAPIIYLDSTDDSVLQQKLKEGVGHYPFTAVPGEVGNSFIFGHSSNYWWDWSNYSSIFANLEQIKIEDKILAYHDDDLYIYQVIETKVVEPTDLSVLEQGNDRRLTLMTCTPLGTNLQRFIVIAKQIN